MKKKLSLFLIITMLALGAFSGCGDEEATEETTAEDKMIAQAIENVQNASSASYEMTMDMSMAVTAGEESQNIDMTTGGSVQYLNDPMSMSMIMTMDMGDIAGTGENVVMETESYGEVVDDNFVMYTRVEDQWTKQTVGSAEEMQQYNTANTMGVYLEAMDSFTEEGVEEVNGSEATKYTGVISGDDLQAVIDNMAGLSDQMATLGLDEASLSTLYADAGDMAVAIWIDNATVMPVKYEMDMAAMMQNIMDKLLSNMDTSEIGEMSYNISNMFISMTVTGYDNVEAIEIPEEARSAQELSEATLEEAAAE
ncbi:MAG: hypothetical protein Q4C00_00440 [Bacillota bacterium]|nr:hypothetical protein [Bacillota bacterium]